MASQMRACHFPATGRHWDASKRPLSVRIDLQHRELLREICNVNGNAEAATSVMCAAWALTLRCYTGLDEVCFGFEETGRSDCALLAPTTVVASIDTKYTLKRLVELCSGEQCLCTEPVDYNTSVLVRYSPVGVYGKPPSIGPPTALSETVRLKILFLYRF